ncbi:MAG: hypothetical protein PHX43_06670 [Alphaproteobacteria bacterium]|nr:hypothetical protein [Alphaproteobacteria bacterium]
MTIIYAHTKKEVCLRKSCVNASIRGDDEPECHPHPEPFPFDYNITHPHYSNHQM